MPQLQSENRRIVLASRPHGKPVDDNFRLEKAPLPQAKHGQLYCAPYGFHSTRTCAVA